MDKDCDDHFELAFEPSYWVEMAVLMAQLRITCWSVRNTVLLMEPLPQVWASFTLAYIKFSYSKFGYSEVQARLCWNYVTAG